MNRDHLNVFADNELVWEGSVGPEALTFDGPVGIRSDNAKLKLQLSSGAPRKMPPGVAEGCRTGPGESE